MADFQIIPSGADGVWENAELNFRNMYLHQLFKGPTPNQSAIVAGDASGFGLTLVNNWPIYDGVGPKAKVVAHAQGMHMRAVNWYNSLIILFDDERFKGSTLQVMGATLFREKVGTSVGEVRHDWAIVGGTGEFEMARGIIKRKVHAEIDGGEIQELSIHAFCHMEKPAPTKLGPWGGSDGGKPQDITAKPYRLESITIRNERDIHSIKFDYIDQAGKKQTGGQWGSTTEGITQPTIHLGPKEFLKEVSGTYKTTVVASIKFVTNLRTYGPYGDVKGTPYKATAPKNTSIVGFFAVTGIYMEKIGVYVA